MNIKNKILKQLTKKRLIIIFLSCMVFTGVCIILAEFFVNLELKKKYQEIADSHKIVRNNTPTDALETEASDEEVEAKLSQVEMLDSNQIARKVSSYTSVLEIPDYDVLCYIYPDTDVESLVYGVGWYKTTKHIGEKGICAVAGHSSSVYNCIMNKAQDIKFMENFYVYDEEGVKHTYYVTGTYIVPPTATGELYSTGEEEYSIFKIITCTAGGSQRLIIEGTELSEKEVEDYLATLQTKKENEVCNIINGVTDITILEGFMEQTKGTPKGYWHYIKQGDDWGFVPQTNREFYQNLTNFMNKYGG